MLPYVETLALFVVTVLREDPVPRDRRPVVSDAVRRTVAHATLDDLCFAVSVRLDAVTPWPPGVCPLHAEAA